MAKEYCWIDFAGNAPTLPELQFLKVSNREEPLRIMESVARNWEHFAISLGFDAARIGIIKRSHHEPEDATMEMFSRWLQGGHDLKSVTWNSVIEGLKRLRLTSIVNILSNMVYYIMLLHAQFMHSIILLRLVI